jgi:hypothetical protein
MKKIIFGLIATVFMIVLSVNAQSKLQPVDIGLGMVSPTIGDCIKGPAFCSSSSDLTINFENSIVAFAKASNDSVKVVFSEKFYNQNKENLGDGLVVKASTTIQLELARRLGFEKAFVVATGTYKIVYSDGKYETVLKRAKR